MTSPYLVFVYEIVFFVVSFGFQVSLYTCMIFTVNVFSVCYLILLFLTVIFPSYHYKFFSSYYIRNYVFSLVNFLPRITFVWIAFFLSFCKVVLQIVFEAGDFYDLVGSTSSNPKGINNISEGTLNTLQLFGIVSGKVFFENFLPNLFLLIFSFLFIGFYHFEFVCCYCNRERCVSTCCFIPNLISKILRRNRDSDEITKEIEEEEKLEDVQPVQPIKIYNTLFFINFFLILVVNCLDFTIFNYFYFLFFLSFIFLVIVKNIPFGNYRHRKSTDDKSKKKSDGILHVSESSFADERSFKEKMLDTLDRVREAFSQRMGTKVINNLIYFNYIIVNIFTVLILLAITLSRFFWFVNNDFTYIMGFMDVYVQIPQYGEKPKPHLTTNEASLEKYGQNSLLKLPKFAYFWNYYIFYLTLFLLFFLLSYSVNLVFYNTVILKKNNELLRKKVKLESQKMKFRQSLEASSGSESEQSTTDIDTSDLETEDLLYGLPGLGGDGSSQTSRKGRKRDRARRRFFGKNNIVNMLEIVIKMLFRQWFIFEAYNYLVLALGFLVLSFVSLTFPNFFHFLFMILIFFGFCCFSKNYYKYCLFCGFLYLILVSNVFFVFNIMYNNTNSVPDGPLRNYYRIYNTSSVLSQNFTAKEEFHYEVNRNLTYSKLWIQSPDLTIFEQIGFLATNFQPGNVIIFCYNVLIVLFCIYLKNKFCLDRKVSDKREKYFENFKILKPLLDNYLNKEEDQEGEDQEQEELKNKLEHGSSDEPYSEEEEEEDGMLFEKNTRRLFGSKKKKGSRKKISRSEDLVIEDVEPGGVFEFKSSSSSESMSDHHDVDDDDVNIGNEKIINKSEESSLSDDEFGKVMNENRRKKLKESEPSSQQEELEEGGEEVSYKKQEEEISITEEQKKKKKKLDVTSYYFSTDESESDVSGLSSSTYSDNEDDDDEGLSGLEKRFEDDIFIPFFTLLLNKIGKNKYINALKDLMINIFFFFVLKYSYLVSLILIYCCIFTSSADLYHGIYFFFFILFIIHYQIAKRFWFLLIIYCECVMISYYVFNIFCRFIFFDPNYQANTNYYLYGKDAKNFFDDSYQGDSPYHSFTLKVLNSVGLKFMNLNYFFGNWRVMGLDFVILFVAYLQWYIFKYNLDNFNFQNFETQDLFLSSAQKKKRKKEKKKNKKKEESKLIKSYQKFSDNMFYLYNLFFLNTHFFLFSCYLIIILVLFFQKHANVMALGYFFLLFLCFPVQFLFPWFLQFVWYIFVIYVFLTLSILYCYQFLFVNLLVQKQYDYYFEPRSVELGPRIDRKYILYLDLNDFGLIVFKNKTLSFIPFAIVLIFSILEIKFLNRIKLTGVYKKFQSSENIKKLGKGIKNKITQFSSQLSKNKDEEDEEVSKMDIARDDYESFEHHIKKEEVSDDDDFEDMTLKKKKKDLLSYFSFLSIRSLFLTSILFIKKFCAIYNMKIIFILLFLNAILDINPIGLVFLIIMIIFSPFPSIVKRIWFLLVIYSELVILLEYLFQFPFFETELKCKPPVDVPYDKLSPLCHWMAWLGLKKMKDGSFIGTTFILPLLLVCFSFFQRICNDWKNEIFVDTKRIEMNLLDEDWWISPKDDSAVRKSVIVEYDGESKKNKKKRRRGNINDYWCYRRIPNYIRFFIELCVLLINHFFDYFGYEISLFLLLAISLVTLKTIWGLILFIFFSVILLLGKRVTKKYRLFSFLIICIGIILIILYIFNFEGGAIPWYDYFNNPPYFSYQPQLNRETKNGVGEIPNYTIVFNYFVLKPGDNGHYYHLNELKATTIMVYLFLILYFMTQYNYKYISNLNMFKLVKKDKYKTPQKLLREERKRMKKQVKEENRIWKRINRKKKEEKGYFGKKMMMMMGDQDVISPTSKLLPKFDEEAEGLKEYNSKINKIKKKMQGQEDVFEDLDSPRKVELELYVSKKSSKYLQHYYNFIINPHNWFDRVKYYFIYLWFLNITLSIFFIDAAIGQNNNLNGVKIGDNTDDYSFWNNTTIMLNQNFLKFFQIILVLSLLNFQYYLYWKTVDIWTVFGIFYIFTMFINAIYQPFLIILSPYFYAKHRNFDFQDSDWFTIFCVFGVNYYQNSLRTNTIVYQNFLVFFFYYVQELIFVHPSYIFYTNYMFISKKKVIEKYQENKIFRSIQLLKNFNMACLLNLLKKENLLLLAKTKKINTAEKNSIFHKPTKHSIVPTQVDPGHESSESEFVDDFEEEEERIVRNKVRTSYFFYKKFKKLFSQKHDFESIDYLFDQNFIVSKNRLKINCSPGIFRDDLFYNEKKTPSAMSPMLIHDLEAKRLNFKILQNEIILYNKKVMKKYLKSCYKLFKKEKFKMILKKEKTLQRLKKDKMSCLFYFLLKYHFIDKFLFFYGSKKYIFQYSELEDENTDEFQNIVRKEYNEKYNRKEVKEYKKKLENFIKIFVNNENYTFERDLKKEKLEKIVEEELPELEVKDDNNIMTKEMKLEQQSKNITKRVSNIYEILKDKTIDVFLLAVNFLFKINILALVYLEEYIFYPFIHISTTMVFKEDEFAKREEEKRIEETILYSELLEEKRRRRKMRKKQQKKKKKETVIDILKKDEDHEKTPLTQPSGEVHIEEEEIEEGGEEIIIDDEDEMSDEFGGINIEEKVKPKKEEEEMKKKKDEYILSHEELERIRKKLSPVFSYPETIQHKENIEGERFLSVKEQEVEDYFLGSLLRDSQRNKFSYYLFVKYPYHLKRFFYVLESAYYSQTDVLCLFMFMLALILSPSIWNCFFTLSALGYSSMDPMNRKWYWWSVIIFTEFLILLEYMFSILQVLSNKPYVSGYQWVDLLGWKNSSELWLNIGVYLCIIIAVMHHRNILFARGEWSGKKRRAKLKKKIKQENELSKRKSQSLSKSFSRKDDSDDEDMKLIKNKRIEMIKKEEEDDGDEDNEDQKKTKKVVEDSFYQREEYERQKQEKFKQKKKGPHRMSFIDVKKEDMFSKESKEQFSELDYENEDDDDYSDTSTSDSSSEDEEEMLRRRRIMRRMKKKKGDDDDDDDSDEDKKQLRIVKGMKKKKKKKKKKKRRKKKKPTSIWKRFKMLMFYFPNFIRNLSNNEKKPLKRDLFAITNVIDIISIAWFIWFFKEISGNYRNQLTTGLANNELSGWLVFWLILFFLVLVLERIIYIHIPSRLSITMKIILHYCLILFYHIAFLVQFNHLMLNGGHTFYLSFWICLKVVVLWFSALQIKYGYPLNTFEEFFASKFDTVSYYTWIVYRTVPFLFELLTLLSWTFKNTSLTIWEWLKLEDIRTELYRRKCWLHSITKEVTTKDSDTGFKKYRVFTKPVGEKTGLGTKIIMGLVLFLALLTVLFFPLIWFSTANEIAFENNAITYIRVRVGIKGYTNFYDNQMFIDDPLFQKYSVWCDKSIQSYKCFRNYDDGLKVQIIDLQPFSQVNWDISQPNREKLVEYIDPVTDPDTHNITINIIVDVNRLGPEGDTTDQITQTYNISDRSSRKDLVKLVNLDFTPYEEPFLELDNFYNPFVIDYATGLWVNTDMWKYGDENWFPNCRLATNVTTSYKTGEKEFGAQYWSFYCDRDLFNTSHSVLRNTGIRFDIQNTKVALSSNPVMSFLNGFGILAFYTTVVLAIGGFLRGLTAGTTSQLFITDICDVDVLYRFVTQIYLAREQKDLVLEETLYRRMIGIYLNPHTIAIWSNDDDSIFNQYDDPNAKKKKDEKDEESDESESESDDDDEDDDETFNFENYDIRSELYPSSDEEKDEEEEEKEKDDGKKKKKKKKKKKRRKKKKLRILKEQKKVEDSEEDEGEIEEDEELIKPMGTGNEKKKKEEDDDQYEEL